MPEGDFIGNYRCICGKSSDAMSVYKKQDGGIDAYCRSGFCDRRSQYISENELNDEGFDMDSVEDKEVKVVQTDFSEIESKEIRGWRERGITKVVSEKYGVFCDMEDSEIVARYYPVTNKGKVVGYKKRIVPKDFYGVGNTKSSNEFFGQTAFESGQKYCVLVTGEEDAMALAQVLKSSKGDTTYWTPVVSVTSGDGSIITQIKANFHYINSFEKVILMFDADDAAQKYVEQAAKLLSPGKAHIAKLPTGCKDANDALMNGKSEALKQCFWKAERYTPASVVGSSDTWDALIQRAKWEKIPLPTFAEDLEHQLCGGIALGEITTIAAASSVGKTSVVNEFIYHFVMNSNYKVGVASLESDVGELIENLLSIHIGKKLSNMNDHEKLDFYQTDKARDAYNELTKLPDGTDRFLIVNHNGDVIDDQLKTQLEFLVASDCKVTIIDPITLALSAEDNQGMDEFMSWLLRFVKSNMVAHINVAHVRKNGSGATANSRGAEISEESIKGSGSQFQVSMNNILLMRDKVHDNPVVRNTTRVVLSKARRTGNTGTSGFWFYNGKTGRLEKGMNPDDVEDSFLEDEELFKTMGAYNSSNPDDVVDGLTTESF